MDSLVHSLKSSLPEVVAPETSPSKQQEARRSGWPKSIYLFYNHFPFSVWSDSIYKIDLPFPNPNSDMTEQKEEPLALTPIAVFPSPFQPDCDEPFPTDMKCIRLGSKFYFLGGILLSEHVDIHGVLPRDVFVMDLAALTGNNPTPQKLGAPLNFGKPNPVVFTAEGKLYVLGNRPLWCMAGLAKVNTGEYLNLDVSMRDKLFECYDPSIGKWEVLETPSVQTLTFWEGATLFEKHGVVLVLGRQEATCVGMLYDLRHQKWTPAGPAGPVLPKYIASVTSDFDESSGTHLLYGLRNGSLPMKFVGSEEKTHGGNCDYRVSILRHMVANAARVGATVELINDSRDLWMSWFDNDSHNPLYDCVVHLHPLGDGYFCYLDTISSPTPYGPDFDGYLAPDPCRRVVVATVFQEILGDGEGEASAPSSFRAKILYSHEYVITTSSYSTAKLASAILVSHDEAEDGNKDEKDDGEDDMQRSKSE